MLEKGSVTIEAVFVVPIVLITMFILCIFPFYLHDQVKIHSILHETSWKGALLIGREEDMVTGDINFDYYLRKMPYHRWLDHDFKQKDVIKQYMIKGLENKLFLLHISSSDIKATENKIELSLSAKSDILKGLYNNQFISKLFSLKEKVTRPIFDAPEFARKYSVFGDVIDNNDTLLKFKNKLSNIILDLQ